MATCLGLAQDLLNNLINFNIVEDGVYCICSLLYFTKMVPFKAHMNENFGSDFELFTISLLAML